MHPTPWLWQDWEVLKKRGNPPTAGIVHRNWAGRSRAKTTKINFDFLSRARRGKEVGSAQAIER